jgi:hypothetical protein
MAGWLAARTDALLAAHTDALRAAHTDALRAAGRTRGPATRSRARRGHANSAKLQGRDEVAPASEIGAGRDESRPYEIFGGRGWIDPDCRHPS